MSVQPGFVGGRKVAERAEVLGAGAVRVLRPLLVGPPLVVNQQLLLERLNGKVLIHYFLVLKTQTNICFV